MQTETKVEALKSSDLGADSSGKVESLKLLKFNYMRQAFGPAKSVTPELNTRLKVAGLTFNQDQFTQIDEPGVTRALKLRKGKKTDAKRIDGPYLLRELSPGKYSIDDLEQLMFMAKGPIRVAITADIRRVASRNSLGAPFQAALGDVEGAIKGDDERRVMFAQLRLANAMRDDFWWQLLRLRQAMTLEVDDAIDISLTRLLKPSVTCAEAEAQRTPGAAIKQVVSNAVEEQEVGSAWPNRAIEKIIERFDYLPLNPDIGVGEIVSKVKLISKPNRAAFNKLLRKTLGRTNPTLWYQMVLVSFRFSKYVDKAVWPIVWSRLTALLPKSMGDDGKTVILDGELPRIAAVHSRLLRYYSLYLEANIPGADSERLAQLAFHFSTRIIEETGHKDSFMQGLIKYLDDRLEQARDIWVIASPPYTQSHLRHILSSEDIPWESLLVESLPSWRSGIALTGFSREALQHVAEHVRLYACDFAKIAPREPGAQSHLFEEWAQFINHATFSKWLADAVGFLDKYSTVESVLGALAAYQSLEEVDRAVSVARFDYFMREGKIDNDTLWNEMTKPEFLKLVETCQEGYLDRVIFGVLTSSMLLQTEKCRQITHWFAHACTKAEDKEHKSLLFHATVLLAMKCLAESAIVRMVAEDRDNRLAEARRNMTHMLTEFSPIAPAWVMGRIRAALAVI